MEFYQVIWSFVRFLWAGFSIFFVFGSLHAGNKCSRDLNTLLNALNSYAVNIGGQVNSEIRAAADEQGSWGLGSSGAGYQDSIHYETPISRLEEMEQLLSLKDGETMVDFGSGLGIPLLYLAARYPRVQFVGYELMEAKVRAATKMARHLGLSNIRFIQQDLSEDFPMIKADHYFLFNSVDRPIQLKILRRIKSVSLEKPIQVMTLYRPDLSRFPWLSLARQSSKWSRWIYPISFRVYQSNGRQSEGQPPQSSSSKRGLFRKWSMGWNHKQYSKLMNILLRVRPSVALISELKNENLRTPKEIFERLIEVMLFYVPEEMREKLRHEIYHPVSGGDSLAWSDGFKIGVQLPSKSKLEKSAFDYLIRIHEFAHLIQASLGHRRTFLAQLNRILFSFNPLSFLSSRDCIKILAAREKGAMSWEWLFGHLLSKDERLRAVLQLERAKLESRSLREKRDLDFGIRLFSSLVQDQSSYIRQEAILRLYDIPSINESMRERIFSSYLRGGARGLLGIVLLSSAVYFPLYGLYNLGKWLGAL